MFPRPCFFAAVATCSAVSWLQFCTTEEGVHGGKKCSQCPNSGAFQKFGKQQWLKSDYERVCVDCVPKVCAGPCKKPKKRTNITRTSGPCMRAQLFVTTVIAKGVGHVANRRSKTSILPELYGISPMRVRSWYAHCVDLARARKVCGPAWPGDAGKKSRSQSSALQLPGRSKNVSHRCPQEVVDAMTA